ncbi:hypothetical protein OG874_36675 [Nocardia sp. NBC_00565]|uniref:hypothetical protein n=1 Tax=unclassified Nocardia TaxID=2637762 RepID=UPI002E81DEBE|nr:hypothetical protein [Nocardia sp. NBC_00565]WUC02215.1 hypothetical protein OG874_36675 [Nocardia sp. NBC_00565]
MAISPEEMKQIALEILGPTLRQSNPDPESQEAVREMDAHRAALEAKGRRPASEEQVKIWQAWGESELKRIAREQGETTE